MKVSMLRGATHGWGIAGEHLSREIAMLGDIEGCNAARHSNAGS